MKTPACILMICFLAAGSLAAADDRIVFGGLDGIDPYVEEPRYRVLLALSGGGIRGLAAVGVLKAFEEKGIEVAGIAGTSMGGIVGGLYAAGYSPEDLERISRELDFAALFQNAPPRTTMLQTRRRDRERDLVTLRFDGFRPRIPQALTSAQYLTNVLTSYTARAAYQSGGDFLKLRVPFATVSTDVISGRKVVMRSGSLADAMRATMAFPLAFTGLDVDGQLLMDGGMIDPIPVGVARELSPDVGFVVAINTASPLVSRDQLETPIDIADQVTTIMTADRLEQSLQEADFVITPVKSGIRSTDYRYCDSLIELGYQAGLKAADSIILLLQDRRDSSGVSISRVECYGLPERYRALAEATLVGGNCTRFEIRNRLRSMAVDSSLYRLEAFLEPISIDSGQAREHLLKVTGCQCIPAGALKLRFVGNTRFDDTTLARVLALEDSLVTPQRLQHGLDRLKKLYYDRGWDLMYVRETVVEPDRNLITIVIDEAVIRGIEVHGARRTRPWYIRSHFPLKTGEPYSTKGAFAGLRNIYGTDLFDRVTVDLVPEEGRPIVHLRIDEKAYRQVRLGWHWDDEYESEEFIELADDNLGGFGLEGIAHARYSPDRRDYHLGFKADRIFKTYLTSRIRGYYTLLDRHLFSDDQEILGKRRERKGGLEVRLGQQIARLGTVSVGLIVEEVKYDFDNQDLDDVTFGLRVLELESLVETFDRVPFTRTGKKHYFELQQAGKLVGGDAEYTRFFTSLEGYFPLGDYLTYHPRVSLGLSRPDLPWSEKFYLGGLESFAGYRTHELAGDRMFLMNQELRLQMPLRLYLTVRYDLGDVFDSADDMKLSSLRHGLGTYLSLDSPIGPIDIGYGVTNHDDQFYLRAGFEF